MGLFIQKQIAQLVAETIQQTCANQRNGQNNFKMRQHSLS